MNPSKARDGNGQGESGDRLDSLMMAAIPRRSRPPPPRPTERQAASAPDTFQNMTIPRRSLSSKPQERSGSFIGGSHAQAGHRRPSGGGSLHQHQHQRQHQQHQSKPTKSSKPPKHVTIQSEYPFVVKIRLRGVPMDNGGIAQWHRPSIQEVPVAAPVPALAPVAPAELRAKRKRSSDDAGGHRSSTRTPKRVRPSYEELGESDGLVDSDEDDDTYAARPKKLRRSTQLPPAGANRIHEDANKPSSSTQAPLAAQEESVGFLDSGSGEVALVTKDASLVEAPPPGMLLSLWYSRECFLHIFVVEKIVGWKRRHVTSLEWQDANALKFIDPHEASTLSQKALTNHDFWNDNRKRMEVSRINVTQCPIVISIAAERERAKSIEDGTTPMYTLKTFQDQREEVLLVKWRGRSYLHCSWERPSDIQKVDPSNSTARHKIRRYYQNQVIALGKDWKRLLEEERATAAAIQSHGESVKNDGTVVEQPDEGDEFFPAQCLEVERIVGCDENEMDLNVLATQRALNIRKEQEQLRLKDEEEEARNGDMGESPKGKKHPVLVKDLIDIHKAEEPWDPEGNVRYVVKWKGLPWAEITWEYWRDIKRDAVDQAEDFWHRQKPPSPELIKEILNIPHPHVRDFRKLQASTAYGISTRERPVAKLDDTVGNPEEEESETKQGFKLRSYQLEGVNWLLFNWWNKRSCILADEMGLGKTVQTLGFLQELWAHPLARVRGPFLIVAPLSLIGQWQSEAASWAPDFNVVLYHGSADAREFLAQQEFFYTDQFLPKGTVTKLKKQHVTKFNLLITTYEVVLKDIAVISKIRWRALIVDEAHRLKNASSRLFAELASVPRDYCVLLTGTPLANNTEELWALLHFDDPVAFGDREGFLEKFGQLSDSTQVAELHNILKPYLLRRVKEDVEKSLPPKEEIILEVTLTPIQKKYYKAIYERNTSFLYKGSKPSNAPSLMNVMMELRKICNHPYLVKGVEDRILADAAANWNAKDAEGKDLPVDHLKIFGEQLVKSSGKMVLLEKLLLKLFTGGHKVLIFSQMVRVLDLLEELLKINKYKYERLDGSTSSSSRASAVHRFNKTSFQRFVMLLSTRAGGLGLNLTSADTIVIFDSDWNPQNDLQAMARAHRIGQTRKVQIFRLLTAKTYEMHMFHSASMKLGLERAVLSQQREQNDDTDESTKKPSERQAHAKEIDELLKKGAYDIFRDEDDAEAEKFMESDIDQLLQRSSKTVTYGAGATASLGSGLGSFSKASFVTDTGDGEKDVDLDDPDFWRKAVGLEAVEEIDEDVAQMIDDGVKRSRKQVQQFNPYAEFEEAEQKKQNKIALKELEEKEEKERERRAKKDKKKKKNEKRDQEEGSAKEDEKNKKIGEKDKCKKKGDAVDTWKTTHTQGATPEAKASNDEEKAKKIANKEGKAKQKKNDRKRALARALNENPLIERLKQAWEAPHRNRATAAILRFGFGRFCKIRHESNLTSLPLQDIEIFARQYIYQLALQVADTFLDRLQKCRNPYEEDFQRLVQEWIGPGSEAEVEWLCSSALNVIGFHLEVESRRRSLRMPIVLAEPLYVTSLRNGAAFRSLRRICLLSRLNRVVEEGLDSVLSVLGHEELAKRGCGTNDLSTLDADLKARHVTTEELLLATGTLYRKPVTLEPPACWWDRNCDVALIVGTFVHGLGNYEAMRSDEDLPFVHNMKLFGESDEACCAAVAAFQAAACSSRGVFDDALESAKAKAALEIQAAVAAAAAAASEREQDALALRQGGAAADAVLSSKPVNDEKNKQTCANDSRFVTLLRLQKAVRESIRDVTNLVPFKEVQPELLKTEDDKDASAEVIADKSVAAVTVVGSLPMPDARVLDRRILELLNHLEQSLGNSNARYQAVDPGKCWEASEDVLASCEVRRNALASIFKSNDVVDNLLSEYSGVGLNGTQCATPHRSLDDGTDYGIGAASAEVSHVAYGTDAPRYLRAIGVPMNLTRFAISALAYADTSCVQEMITTEFARYQALQTNDEDLAGDQVPEEKPTPQAQPSSPATSLSMMFMPATSSIPEIIQQNVKVRAAICMAVLLFGFPSTTQRTHIDACLWTALKEQIGAMDDNEPGVLFNMDKFLVKVKSFAGDDDVPDVETVRHYVEKALLPFCFRLCVMGNGPSLQNSRGSKGEYETALGISQYAEPSKEVPSPLPDPCMTLMQQSLEAVSYASAILRRVRLMRATLHIACGEVSVEQLDQAARSSFMCKNLDNLPLWWCPWMHDVALLVHAASNGLFSVIGDREKNDPGSAFCKQSIVQTMYSTFVADENVLPMAIVERSAPDDINKWIDLHADEFPTVNGIERRLSFLCAEATKLLSDEVRYDNLPMFDHGGWPRA